MISLPRCYTTPELEHRSSMRDIHIFCDASEQAYGAVAYLRSDNPQGKVEIAFLTARVVCSSHWSPVGKGSQNAVKTPPSVLLPCELIQQQYSPGCFQNPADSKSLWEGKVRWSQGPQFLRLLPAEWPEPPCLTQDWQDDEVRRPILCNLMTSISPLPDRHEYQTLSEYLEATVQQHHSVAEPSDCPTASEYAHAALDAIHQAQMDSFLSEVTHLKAGKPVPANSCLL
ncbi:hypothetical protein MHYP_G00079940 [Metynnis hypsauchen]